MWYSGAQQLVWVQIGNTWRQVLMAMGVCQGGCSAKQDFTLAFARAQRTADGKVAATLQHHPAAQVGKRLFMDDECLRVTRGAWRPVLEAVQEGLAEHGYRLRLDKTKAHCPAAQANQQLADALREELNGYAEFLQNGLPLLGKVADGEHLTIVTAEGPLQGPTIKRMEAARELAKGIHAMIDAEFDGKRAGPAWKLTSLVLNKALSYDVCVSPPGRIRPHTDELDGLVADIARRLTDPARVDSSDEWQSSLAQLRRPRRHGGLDLVSATEMAPFAFLGTTIAIQLAATHGLARLHHEPDAIDHALQCLE